MLKPSDYILNDINNYLCYKSHCIDVTMDEIGNLFFIQKTMNPQSIINNSTQDDNLFIKSIYAKDLCIVLEDLEDVFSSSFDALRFLKKNPILCRTESAVTLITATQMLKDLYALYLCYIAEVWGAKIHNNAFYDYIKEEIDEVGIVEESGTIYNDYILTSASFADISCSFSIIPGKNNKLCENRLFNDYFSALKFMLLEYIMLGSAGINGYSIYHCENCGKEFVRDSKKKRLCSFCSSPSQRTRLCRERKAKEVLNNAEKK